MILKYRIWNGSRLFVFISMYSFYTDILKLDFRQFFFFSTAICKVVAASFSSINLFIFLQTLHRPLILKSGASIYLKFVNNIMMFLLLVVFFFFSLNIFYAYHLLSTTLFIILHKSISPTCEISLSSTWAYKDTLQKIK